MLSFGLVQACCQTLRVFPATNRVIAILTNKIQMILSFSSNAMCEEFVILARGNMGTSYSDIEACRGYDIDADDGCQCVLVGLAKVTAGDGESRHHHHHHDPSYKQRCYLRSSIGHRNIKDLRSPDTITIIDAVFYSLLTIYGFRA